MQRTIFILFLILIVYSAHSQTILDIKFNSIQSGKIFVTNTTKNLVDTIQIKNGSVSLSNEINTPTLYSLIVEGYNDSRPMRFILSPEKTEIVFDNLIKVLETQNIREVYPNQPYFQKDPNDNQVFYKFHSEWVTFYEKIMELSTSESDSEELLDKRKEVYNLFLSQCETSIKNNSDKYVSAVIVDFLLQGNLLPLEVIQTYYDHLKPNVKDSFFGIRIGEYAGKMGKLSPSNPAPKFKLYDLNNKEYDLESLRGKKILLHFWSSSCAPCLEEAPDLIKLSEDKKNSLIIINISLDIDSSRWKKGIEKAGIDKMINVCDFKGFESKTTQDYLINIIPSYYLIDENGIILIKGSLNQIKQSIL